MIVKINKPVQGGTIPAIASKSEAHRLLICAALADCKTHIICQERSADIDATVNCLEALGASATYDRNGFSITPINRQLQKSITSYKDLLCDESASTLRFLLPICGGLGFQTSFHLGNRLAKRPLDALLDEMASHGCILSKPDSSLIHCEGQLYSGVYTLPGDVSSQYVSGLLFALPLLSGDSLIKIKGILESRPYVDMTLEALRLFGITICEDEEQSFHVLGGQAYLSPNIVRVSGDWSNAAFWLCAGALGNHCITCTGLNMDSRQGDRIVTKLLSRFGARVVVDDNSVTVSPGILRGIDINARDIPDLVPVLAAVASVAEGKTVIHNAGRLRIKESNRLETVTKSLSYLGADITQTQDGLVIVGKRELSGGETQSFGDHRIAMASAILSGACLKPVVIRDAQVVRKSYPCFFKDFSTVLFGKCEVIG